MKGPILYFIEFLSGGCDMSTVILSVFSFLVIIFLCFPIHECAHAWVAKLLGDDTAESQGRITLNPLAHIDPMGAVCMAVCCIGWAKPTPVDLRKCRKVSMRTANVLVSLAGPVSNIVLSLIIMVIYKIIIVASGMALNETTFYVVTGLMYVVMINAFLAVFNLLPIPPFDGYHILASFLPSKWLYNLERYNQIISFVMFILLVSRVLDRPLAFLQGAVFDLLDMMTRFIC